jgi:hypothetical protein
VANDDKKIKGDPAPKSDALPKDKSAADAAPPKAESNEGGADSSSSYSRGEGQKPVTKAYRDNWSNLREEEKALVSVEGQGVANRAQLARRQVVD